jgi:hypothetical protein
VMRDDSLRAAPDAAPVDSNNSDNGGRP